MHNKRLMHYNKGFEHVEDGANNSRGKRPPYTEAQDVAPVVGGAPEAAGRTEELRTVDPGTAADARLEQLPPAVHATPFVGAPSYFL